MMRPRPAPIAARIAISRWRSAARASSRLATFAQAMSSTSPTAPSRMRRVGLMLRTMTSRIANTAACSESPIHVGFARRN